jgi:SpoVK/Ycf46/Vps4 family AAA+-type ATPase
LWDDFQHVTAYLQAALAARTRGVNILLYGSPGTGKTEFAAVIAAHLGVPMFQVPDDTDPKFYADDQARIKAYRMAQKLLAPASALVVFDDLEDGILDWEAGLFAKRTSGKAALNGLLETNSVPAIWITNAAELMEPSHLRRFDYAIAFKAVPRSIRASLIDKGLHGLPVSDALKADLADDRLLTPAQVNKIAKVVGHLAPQIGPDDGQARLDGLAHHVYQAARKLRFQAEPGERASRHQPIGFDPAFINASLPAGQIIEAFRNAPGLAGCFHGLPGSGKTALAEHIAWSLDKPLLVKRGSDLLRPYLGETEIRLKGMFEEAMDEDAVLLLDEADSFLADRERAQRSWEVTQVNELLTQIERYRGHFIATTNAFGMLDPASLRRFDLKVRFDPLKPEQRLRLLDVLLRSLGLTIQAAPDDVQHVVDGMGHLTPGDYAVVARRLASSTRDVDAATVIDALREEHLLKKPQGRPAGFIH